MAKQTKQEATPIVANSPAPVNNFEQAKRAFEAAYASGDYAEHLTTLAKIAAASVISKVADPQRKAAQTADAVSNSGLNPAIIALRQGMYADNALLANTAYTADKATQIAWTDDGYLVTETADKDAAAAIGKLCRETLSDGIDLEQTAALALLEQAAEHAAPGAWLDAPYTVRRLSKRVYIQHDESAAYADAETTPMQEVYRAVRREIASSRAVQTDPRNGYTYIDAQTPDENDVIFYRCGRYADIGGYDVSGNYTTDRETVDKYEDILRGLRLTRRQTEIVLLRMRGYGSKAIASYLGIRADNVKLTLKRIRAKCEAIGLTPAMWREMTAE